MPADVLYVHGVGQRCGEARLKRRWDHALFGREMGDRSRMAYWGAGADDEGLTGAAEESADLVRTAEVASATEPASPEDFTSAVADRLRATRLTPWLRRMSYAAEALAEGRLALPPPPPGPEARELLGGSTRLLFRALIEVVFREAYAYFFGGRGEEMRQVVRDALAGLQSPVIVCHSFGTVIAYDVLREPASRSLTVPLLVTAGSPLGVNEVAAEVQQPLRVPDAVAEWLNVADARDVVTLNQSLRAEYPPPDRLRDVDVRNDGPTHHSIVAYLRTQAVRGPVRAVVPPVGGEPGEEPPDAA